jgi:hypothetical protein
LAGDRFQPRACGSVTVALPDGESAQRSETCALFFKKRKSPRPSGNQPADATPPRAFCFLDRLSSSGDRDKTHAAWASFCHVLPASTEFRFLE